MKKVYLIDENTKLNEYKFSKNDIIYAVDIKSYVSLKKKKFNTLFLDAFLDGKGHKYIAKNLIKYLKIINNFSYIDSNNLKKTYFINMERKIYFFISNYLYINYLSIKFFKKYKKSYKIINLLKNNFDPNMEIKNNNNIHYFFFQNERNIQKKKSYNFINLRLFNKFKLFLISFLMPKNYLGILPDDHNLQKFILKIKKKYNFKSIVYFNNNKVNFLKKKIYYLFPIFKVSELLFLDNKKDLNIKKQIDNILNNKTNLIIEDKRFSYLLDIYLNNFLSIYLNNLSRKSENLYKFFKKNKPKLIIAKRSSDTAYSIGEISRKLNFDSILVSHASHIYNKNKLSMFDWTINSKSTINSDYKFVASQSKFSDEFLNKINVKSKILKTGPLILTSPPDTYVKTDNNKYKIILHASTPKNISNFRAINYETTYDYIENLKQQIIALKDKKNVHFIIKFREYDFLRLNDFKYLMPKTKNFEIDTKSNLKDLLERCDYLSSYSSTVIEEALYFGKDIILYDKNDLYKHLYKSKYKINKNKVSKIYYLTKPSRLRNIFKKI